MLEGLEIEEVNFKKINQNKDIRFDSNFWTKLPKRNINLSYIKIGDCLNISQYGISINMNDIFQGYPIYRMNEIHNMLCDFEVAKYADISKNELKIFNLEDRDVLFNRTNSYEWVGRTGLYRKIDERDFVFASYLVRFVPNQEKILPEYLTCFLNTKFGIWDIKRRCRQSVNQTNVNPEEIKQIDIPLLSMTLQMFLKKNFDKAIKLLQRSKQFYNQAETLLLNSLNFNNFFPNTSNINIRSFKESYLKTGRLDAEYYQVKYEEIIKLIKNYKYGYEYFNYFVDNYSTGYPYKSENYVENGIPLIRINNIKKGYLDLSECSTISENDKFLSPQDIARENDILISMSGTIGNTCKIPKGITALINQRIMRITTKNFDVNVFPLLINSIIGNSQLEQIGTGGVQTNISAKDVLKILVPKIEENVQNEIALLVKKSFYLKSQSERLLEVAKQAVEIAIEQNEAIAMKFLEDNSHDGYI